MMKRIIAVILGLAMLLCAASSMAESAEKTIIGTGIWQATRSEELLRR